LILMFVVLTCGIVVMRRKKAEDGQSEGEAEKAAAGEDADETYEALKVEPVEVHAGVTLVPLVSGVSSLFLDRIAAFRKQHALDSGLVLPRVRFRESAKLGPNAYEILVFGVPAGRGEILKDRLLAIHSGGEARKLAGVETRDPTYGLPAVWIEE